jgi:hypothetical protein
VRGVGGSDDRARPLAEDVAYRALPGAQLVAILSLWVIPLIIADPFLKPLDGLGRKRRPIIYLK